MYSRSVLPSVTSSSIKTTVLDPITVQDDESTSQYMMTVSSLTPNSKVDVK